MRLMESGVAYARLDPDSEERFLPLRRMLGVTSFGLNQILLRPGQRGRIHRHTAQEEVYVVLAGTLTLGVEGSERELGQGELARVAPDVRRQISNRGTEDVFLVVRDGPKGLFCGGDPGKEARHFQRGIRRPRARSDQRRPVRYARRSGLLGHVDQLRR